MAKSQWGFDDFDALMKSAKRIITAEVAVVTQTYFENSWKKQGWNGEHWMERKTKGKKNSGKAILVQSGRLRRSFVRISERWERIEIVNSAPYAYIHNEGFKGIQYIKPHKRGKTIKVTVKGSGYFDKGKFKKGKRRQLKIRGDLYNVDGFSRKMNMPKRQFLGHTSELENKQIYIIQKSLNNLFK